MKKIHLILAVLVFQTVSFSQNAVNKIVAELNSNYKTYGVDSSKTKIYLNREQKTLDIAGNIIPITETEIVFEKDNRVYKGVKIIGSVFFKCELNCISEGTEYHSAVGFGFKSKDGAYKFIDLMFDLKKELEKD